jgi:hypothetical protein
MNREKLWAIGVLLIVFGGSLFVSFVLSNEGIYYFSVLSDYSIGFFITGLITSIFGFLLSIASLDSSKSQIKTNTTRIRIVFAATIILYLFLIAYLIYTDQEWTVKALIIHSFKPSFGFYETFTWSSYSVLFGTLIIFGVFILPFAVNELEILNHHPDVPFSDYGERGQTLESAENSVTRLTLYLKKKGLGRIKALILPVGLSLTIIGSCLMGLPHFLFIDGPWTFDPKVEVWYIEDYKGFIRGKLLLIGVILLVVGILFILVYIRHRRNSKGNTN